MAYNLTSVGSATHLLGFYDATNDASGGLIVALTLIAVFVIFLFSLIRNNPVPESFTGASTITTIVALIFVYLELASIIWVVGFGFLWALSAIALYRSNSV